MSRKAAWSLVQVLLTGVAMFVVLRLVRFHDLVKADDRPPAAAKAVDGLRVTWADGTSGTYAKVEVAEFGFLSIFERADKRLFFLMLGALFLPFALLTLRWWLLLRGHGFAPPFGQVFLVNYAGIFFNHLLPGGVGGDLTKAVLASAGEERKAAVVATVLLDRLIGLGVLVFLGAACLLPYAGRFEDRRLVWAVFGLAGAAVLAYLLYFNPRVRAWLGPKLPFAGIRGQLDGVFRSAKERKGLMGVAALISLASQVTSILIIYGMARALGLRQTPLWMFFVFEPIIFIVNALPISVGGWGVQEGIYAALFGRLGGMSLNEAVALSVLYKVSMLLASVPGGLLFALGATRRRG
ncbi:MAG TPA: lysylphosphatidylglycerol synthase transmembrane domain-containing protein [Planctomycetota bacterium]